MIKENTFLINEITKIQQIIDSKKELFDKTRDIRSMFDASKNMYSDDSAFIFELIQNADDCNARKVTISLTEESFILEHDGKCFDIKDIEQITKADSSENEKKDNYKKIGKFGIGFKSVFNVTDRPLIHSGKYKFEIENYIIPKFIIPNMGETNNLTYNELESTIITLKLKKEEYYDLIKSKLEKLSGRDILFLNNIQIVEININNEKLILEKKYIKELMDSKYNEIYNNMLKKQYISLVNIKDKFYFIINSDAVKTQSIQEKNLCTKIAFEMKRDNNDKYELIKIEDSTFNVFFPTNTYTGINFLLQGNYTVGMNRKELNNSNQNFLNDSNNLEVLKFSCEILKSAIKIFFELGMSNKSLLDILLDNEKDSEISRYIYSTVQQYFEDGNPFNISSETNNIDEIVFADDSEIMNIFNIKDIYPNCYWCNSEYIEFYDFFSNKLNLKSIDLEYIKQLIEKNKNILEKVNIENLYKYLMKNKEKIQDLRFIETIDGQYESINVINLYKENKINNLEEIKKKIEKETQLHYNPIFIAKKLSENEEIVDILKLKPLTYEMLIKFIENEFFKENVDNLERYFSGIKLLLELLKISNGRFQLNNVKVLVKNENNKYNLKNQNDVYFSDEKDIKELMIKSKALSIKDFVDNDVYEKYLKEQYNEFKGFIYNCSQIKVNFNDIAVVEAYDYKFYNRDSNEDFKKRAVQESYMYTCNIYNPKIINIDRVLDYITNQGDEEESKILFKLVIDFFRNTYSLKGYFKYYYYKYRTVYLKEIDIVTMLKEYKWIIIDGKKRKTSDVSLNTLIENGFPVQDIDEVLIKKICNILQIETDTKQSKNLNNVISLLFGLDKNELKIVEEWTMRLQKREE